MACNPYQSNVSGNVAKIIIQKDASRVALSTIKWHIKQQALAVECLKWHSFLAISRHFKHSTASSCDQTYK